MIHSSDKKETIELIKYWQTLLYSSHAQHLQQWIFEIKLHITKSPDLAQNSFQVRFRPANFKQLPGYQEEGRCDNVEVELTKRSSELQDLHQSYHKTQTYTKITH